MSSLKFKINKVQCLDETGGIFELGMDDIYLAAVTVDARNKEVGLVPAFKVGKFNDGMDKTYNPPHDLVTFPNLSEGVFPKGFMVFLVLIEKDSGNEIEPFLQSLVEQAKAQINAPKLAAVGVDDVVMVLIKELAEFLKEKYMESRKDDIFSPETVKISIPNNGWSWKGSSESPQAVLVYVDNKKLHAKYYIHYSWAIS